jgi:hypothetical protein
VPHGPSPSASPARRPGVAENCADPMQVGRREQDQEREADLVGGQGEGRQTERTDEFARVDERAADAEGARHHPEDTGEAHAAGSLTPGPRDEKDAGKAEQRAADRTGVDRLLSKKDQCREKVKSGIAPLNMPATLESSRAVPLAKAK